mmetsp:Transcript_1913/g.11802  ORF Transcript_1913/g.11802 Transcript_1913/m.11802 type:complete len:123 (+) Transcript_1913:2304-2672(+)
MRRRRRKTRIQARERNETKRNVLACVQTCVTCDEDHVGAAQGTEAVPDGVLHERRDANSHRSDGWMHMEISTDQVQARQCTREATADTPPAINSATFVENVHRSKLASVLSYTVTAPPSLDA